VRRSTPALHLIALLFVSVIALVSCDAGGASLSVGEPSVREIVPGSSGIGKPEGAIEVPYRLGKPGMVTASLAGPVKATLVQGEQKAGDHLIRFNGVIQTDEISGTSRVVRHVVPDGDYTITIATDEGSGSTSFKVSGSTSQSPTLSNVVLHPDVISPNSDAVDDVGEVTFRTNETTTVSVDLLAPDGTRTGMLAPTKRGPGEQNVVVNGQNVLGDVLPDGTYTVTVRAQDAAGNMVEAQRPLKIEGGGEPQIEISRVDISPQQTILGNSVNVSITVKNVGNVPLRTQGPDPGYTYTTNDSYSSIEGGKWTDKAGLWRVGVDWDGNSGGGPAYRYPFRWGFGKTLMPGESVTTGGKITILKPEREMWFYAGVLQEGIRIVLDRLGRTKVGVDF